jgi:hypothetical protein
VLEFTRSQVDAQQGQGKDGSQGRALDPLELGSATGGNQSTQDAVRVRVGQGSGPARTLSTGSERAEEEKRVRNDRIKAVLRAPLEYPTFREGMTAIVVGADIRPFHPGDLAWLGLGKEMGPACK